MSKRLFRSKGDNMIGGVAGGLAKYFDIEPVIIRGLFIITFFAYGFGFLSYIVLWIIVPIESNNDNFKFNSFDKNIVDDSLTNNDNLGDDIERKNKMNETKIYGAVLLISIGVLLFINQLIPQFNFKIIFSILLIVFGFLILFLNRKKILGN